MGKHSPTPNGEPVAALVFRLATEEPDTDVFPAVSGTRRVYTRSRLAATLVGGAVMAGVAVAPHPSFDPPVPVTAEIPDPDGVFLAVTSNRLSELAASRYSRTATQAAASQVQAAAEQAAQASLDAAAPPPPPPVPAEPSEAVTEAVSTANDPTESVPSAASPGTAAGIAVETAMAQLGKPYVWAAEGPDAFDCSGLVLYAYAAAGIDLPRVSSDQARAGVAVSREDLQPGDLVAFYSPVSHIGIYIGDGQIVHAPTPGDVVKVTDIDAFGSGSITALRRVA